ncbi:hypothetical protein L208DRAFT_1547394 [Tricholoma matsutake]|nr:hypothetical protein L208DRAFT_1547394 [Tricholoma matsutake 945]
MSFPKTPKFFIHSVQIEPKITLTVGLKTVDTHAAIDVEALLDSGATGLFINRSLITRNGINTCKLVQPIMVYNIDGTVNRRGTIKEEVTMVLKYQEHQEQAIATCYRDVHSHRNFRRHRFHSL